MTNRAASRARPDLRKRAPQPEREPRDRGAADAPGGLLALSEAAGNRATSALLAADAGRGLDPGLARLMQAALGVSFADVRLHTDGPAQALTRAAGAAALTTGADVYLGPAVGALDRPRGRWVLAHELTHVLQQRRGGEHGRPAETAHEAQAHQAASGETSAVSPVASGSIQAIDADVVERYERARKAAREPFLPSTGLVSAKEDLMWTYLARESEEYLGTQEQVAGANLQVQQERDQAAAGMRRLVRLSAIGLMASHRAHLADLRDQTLAAGRAAETRGSLLGGIREAAKDIDEWQRLRAALIDNQNALERLRSRAWRERDRADAQALAQEIYTTAYPLASQEESDRLKAGLEAEIRAEDAWQRNWFTADALLKRRGADIQRANRELADLYARYPFFAKLEAADVVGGGSPTDQALMNAVQTAFAHVIEGVDDGIRKIATEDIHPFDLPVAVAAARAGLDPAHQQLLDREVRSHQTIRFWLSMGLSLAQALVVFVPVVGPAVALTMGVALQGQQLEDMLDRQLLSEVGANPYGESTLGVEAPSTGEKVMFGVGVVATGVEAGLMVKGLRAPKAPPESGTPGASTRRPPEPPPTSPGQVAELTAPEGGATVHELEPRLKAAREAAPPGKVDLGRDAEVIDLATRRQQVREPPPTEPQTQAQPVEEVQAEAVAEPQQQRLAAGDYERSPMAVKKQGPGKASKPAASPAKRPAAATTTAGPRQTGAGKAPPPPPTPARPGPTATRAAPNLRVVETPPSVETVAEFKARGGNVKTLDPGTAKGAELGRIETDKPWEWQASKEALGEGEVTEAMRVENMPKTAEVGGGAQPESLTRGNFSHENAELLIDESQLPRALEPEWEVDLGNGDTIRPDRVDFHNGEFYEIRPEGRAAREMERAMPQREALMNQHQSLGPGRKWKGHVVTYSNQRALEVMMDKFKLSRPNAIKVLKVYGFEFP